MPPSFQTSHQLKEECPCLVLFLYLAPVLHETSPRQLPTCHFPSFPPTADGAFSAHTCSDFLSAKLIQEANYAA